MSLDGSLKYKKAKEPKYKKAKEPKYTITSTGLGNYYGSVEFYQGNDGKFYMGLENYAKYGEVQISEEFYRLAVMEFEELNNG